VVKLLKRFYAKWLMIFAYLISQNLIEKRKNAYAGLTAGTNPKKSLKLVGDFW
jgi:hypothetical protein